MEIPNFFYTFTSINSSVNAFSLKYSSISLIKDKMIKKIELRIKC